MRRSRRRQPRAKAVLPTLALLYSALACPTQDLRQPLEISAQRSPLYSIAEQAMQDSEQAQRDFAWIAVVEMIAAHEAALRRGSQSRSRYRDDKRKLQRWSAAMNREIARLQGLLQALEAGAASGLDVQGASSVLVFVAGEPIVVSDPEMGSGSQLEHRIIEHYCLLHLCAEPVAAAPHRDADVATTRAPQPLEPTRGHWSFGQDLQPRYETADGLIFEFRSLGDRRRTELACEGLVADLRALATRLQEVQETGFRIDWDQLRLESLDTGGEQWIILNPYGDFVRLDAPFLSKAQEVLRQTGPWLRALADGTPAQQVVHLSEQYLRQAPLD